jgi:hypothetical protein
MKFPFQTLAIAVLLSSPAVLSASTIPASTGTALDGHSITLPQDLPGRVSILILGFSKNSADPTTAWEKATRTSLANSTIGYLDIPFLQDAPSFVRPMILRSIRKQVPDIVKPNFVPLATGEAAWKQATNFTPASPDAAYILLVDKSGTIRWQTHEPYAPAIFEQLTVAAKNLAAESK